jgi:hypothetical protein
VTSFLEWWNGSSWSSTVFLQRICCFFLTAEEHKMIQCQFSSLLEWEYLGKRFERLFSIIKRRSYRWFWRFFSLYACRLYVLCLVLGVCVMAIISIQRHFSFHRFLRICINVFFILYFEYVKWLIVGAGHDIRARHISQVCESFHMKFQAFFGASAVAFGAFFPAFEGKTPWLSARSPPQSSPTLRRVSVGVGIACCCRIESISRGKNKGCS